MKIEMRTDPDHNIKNQEVGFALNIWWKLSQVKMSSENASSDYIQDVIFTRHDVETMFSLRT